MRRWGKLDWNRQKFTKIYYKLQAKIVPGLKHSQSIYEDVLNEHCEKPLKWLDLGCGHHLLPPWRLEQEKRLIDKAGMVVGIDYDHLSLTKHKTIKNRLRGDISHLPFPDSTFDLITSNMVFEHLEHPEKQLKEIYRVLSSGGKLIFHTPNRLGYTVLMARVVPDAIKGKIIYFLEGRKEEDVFPTFYRINSFAEINSLAKLSGFNVLKIKRVCSSAVFGILTPIVLFELFYIRFLLSETGKSFRTNLIVVLEKA